MQTVWTGKTRTCTLRCSRVTKNLTLVPTYKSKIGYSASAGSQKHLSLTVTKRQARLARFLKSRLRMKMEILKSVRACISWQKETPTPVFNTLLVWACINIVCLLLMVSFATSMKMDSLLRDAVVLPILYVLNTANLLTSLLFAYLAVKSFVQCWKRGAKTTNS